jgi:hypothetical protein
MKKALELAAGLDGNTTATYASQLLTAAIKDDIKDNPVLYDKWLQLEKQAMKQESWDEVESPMIIPAKEEQLLAQSTQKGWFISGDNPDGYSVGQDKAVRHKEIVSGFIRSKREDVKGFGTIMQQTGITKYAGKKLSLSAYIKNKDVKNWAGLWARLDDKDLQVLWFDNMQNRPIKGTTGWRKYAINFEIPKGSVTLSFGVLLVGSGNVWINDVGLVELEVNKKTPVEDLPITLDF